MKFTLNRKSLMKFGKWSLAFFSLIILVVFVSLYVIPSLAIYSPPQTNEINVTLNTPSDAGTTSNSNLNFTYNVVWNNATTNITNCTLVGNFTGSWVANATNSTPIVNNTYNGINVTLVAGVYSWNIYCYNITNVGNYSASNWTVTVDAPILNATTPANASYIYGTGTQEFRVNVSDNTLNLSNVTLHHKRDIGAVWQDVTLNCTNMTTANTSFTCSGNQKMDTWYSEGHVVVYYFEGTSKAGLGSNGTKSDPLRTTIDQSVPTYSSNTTTPSSPMYALNQKYQFNITWADSGSGIGEVIFEWNNTDNYTSATDPAVENRGSNNYGIVLTDLNGSYYTYRWFANDSVLPTSDTNWNSTPNCSYNISRNTSTSTLIHIKLNDTADTDTTYFYPNVVNATGYKDMSEGSVSLYRNGTNVTINSTSQAENTSTLANATWYFSVNYSQTENYTAGSRIVWVYMNKGPVNLTYFINSTQSASNTNKTIDRAAAVNITVTVNNSQGIILLYRDGVLENITTYKKVLNETTYTGVPGQEWNITAVYNGSENYSASSSVWNFIIIESTPPTYSSLVSEAATSATVNNATNSSIIGKYGGGINISTQWNDGYNLSYFWLRNDSSESWVNSTYTSFLGITGNWSNITIDPSTFTAGITFNATIFANDTSGNENFTTTYRWTIDNTDPVLNTTTPANASYINGSTNELFQVYAYDDTLNISNVTLHHKLSGAGWKNTTLTCYNTTIFNNSFICNTTLDMPQWYSEADVVLYYFEATDYSWLHGSNGTYSDTLRTTVDQTSPTWSDLSTNTTNNTHVSKGASINVSSVWNDGIGLDKYWLWSNMTDDVGGKNYTVQSFDTGNLTNVTIDSNTTIAVGAIIMARIYANDTEGNENVTQTWWWSIDNITPTWSQNITNVTNGSTIAKGTVINITANWTDNVKLHRYWCSNDSSESWENSSLQSFTTANNLSDCIIYTASLSSGLIFNATIYANDTSANENKTGNFRWTIDGTPPTYWNKSDSEDGEAIYAPGATYRLNMSYTDNLEEDDVSTVLLNFSGKSSNETASNHTLSNYSVTLTDLAAGNYTYRWFANDTSNNWNRSIIYTFNITQNTTTSSYLNLTLGNGTTVAEGNNTLMYPETNNATGYFNSTALSGQVIGFTLVKNGTEVGATNPISENIQYAATTVYNYTYNTSGNANYSSASKEYWSFVVRNNTNPIEIWIQNSTDAYKNTNVTDSAGQIIIVNATSVYGNETELKLYSNGTQVSNPNQTEYSSAMIYNFTATIAATNYTANASVPTFWLTITEDTLAPTVTLYNYADGTILRSGDSLTLNISVSDATGVTQGDPCNVTINGTINKSITVSDGWCNGTITVPTVDADGNYTLNITVRDNSSNRNHGENSTYNLTVDNTTPVITSLTITNDTYNLTNAIIFVNGTVYDLIKMSTGNITVTGTNASTFDVYSFNGTNNTQFAVYNNTTVSDGFIELTLTYSDNASNSISAAVQFYVDNNPTTSFLALTGGTQGNSSTQNVQVNITDNLMTNETITLHYKRGSLDTSWQSTTMTGTPAASTIYTGSIDTSMLADDEIVYYYVSGIDNATNAFSTSNGTETDPLSNFRVGDVTSAANPESVSVSQVGSTRGINVSWSASASGDVVRYNVYYENGIVTTSSSSRQVGNVTNTSITVGSDGNWNFTVTAIDSSNNENTTIVTSANITIDITVPSVTNSNTAPVKDSDGKISDNTPTIVVNISEAGTCYFDEVDVAAASMTYEMSDGAETQNHNYTFTTALNDSTYTYYIRCIDTAGNTMTLSATLSFILDTTGNFNYTQDLTGSSSGTWNTLWIPTQSVMEVMGYTAGTTSDWNISYVLTTTGGLGTNYILVYYYNGTGWASFSRGSWDASSLQYTNNTNDSPYWINVTTTDRFEI